MFNFFVDVQTIPENGIWFQLIGNGTTTVNNGPNGLQRLDKVVQLAEKHGIFLQLALTNNWNPLPLVDKTTTGLGMISRDVTHGTNNSLPRNYLSNDYGQQFINSLVFELKSNVQGEWMSTSEHLVNAPSTIMMTSIQTRRFLIPS
jgi:mannan endo-1,4-beta-mannosidase